MGSSEAVHRGPARRVKDGAHQIVTQFALRRPGIVQSIIHERGTPALDQLYKTSSRWCGGHECVVEALIPGAMSEHHHLFSDGRVVIEELHGRASNATLPYPDTHATEDATLMVLYSLVRITKPRIILETGVANGFSSEVVLQALASNGRGELHSVDIREDVGALVTERDRWNLHLIDVSRRGALESVIDALPPIGLFFHDADHRYRPQLHEFEAVWPRMSSDGILASDDVDASFAFIDFATSRAADAVMLLDRRKVSGYLRKTPLGS